MMMPFDAAQAALTTPPGCELMIAARALSSLKGQNPDTIDHYWPGPPLLNWQWEIAHALLERQLRDALP